MRIEAEAREHTNTMLADVKALIGSPGTKADGSDATGLYDVVRGLNSRVGKFERLWYQVLGGIKVGAPIVLVSATLLWFLAGDKITKLLHG